MVIGAVGRSSRSPVQPAVELPAHPIGRGILGQRFGTSPNPLQLLTIGGDGMDGQPGASDPGGLQAAMQFAGQRPAGERRGVHPVHRRIAVHHGVELRRRFPARRSARRLPAGEPVRD